MPPEHNRNDSKSPLATFNEGARGGGGKMLAVTGLVLVALTVGGAVAKTLEPEAFWATLFFSVSIAGLVGFSTNWVAIKMLFHPRVRMLGVQGVVPRRRIELARSVGRTLEKHLISGDRMHRLLLDSGAVEDALTGLSNHLPELLSDEDARESIRTEVRRTISQTVTAVADSAKGVLKEKAHSNLTALVTGSAAAASFGPMAGLLAVGVTKSGLLDKFVEKMVSNLAQDLEAGDTLDRAADKVVAELPGQSRSILADEAVRARLRAVFVNVSEELMGAIDVAGLVEQELLDHDDAELEELIDSVASNELSFVQVAGGGLGMVAGLALIWPWLLLPIGALFVVLWRVGRVLERRAANAPDNVAAPEPAPDFITEGEVSPDEPVAANEPAHDEVTPAGREA